MGRRPQVEGVRRDRLSPAERGLSTVYVGDREDRPTKSRLLNWCKANGHATPDDGINALLDAVEHQIEVPASVPSPSVPWDSIREALLEELGFINHEKIDRALRSAGMPT